MRQIALEDCNGLEHSSDCAGDRQSHTGLAEDLAATGELEPVQLLSADRCLPECL